MDRPTLSLALLASIAAAGCGSSGSSKPVTGGKATTIDMKNIQFSPKNVKVPVGAKITWVNKDSVAHDVAAIGGASFKSDSLGQNQTYTVTVTKPGTIAYVCTFHPGMSGTITVSG